MSVDVNFTSDISSEKQGVSAPFSVGLIQEFFKYFKSKCPKYLRHKFDNDRKCTMCGMVAMASWQLTTAGREYYNTHSPIFERDEIRRKILNIMNIISHQNFDKLSKQIIEVISKDVHNQIQLHESAKQIFNKLLMEPKFIPTYASLCSSLSNISVKTAACDNNKRQKYKRCSFKREILNISMEEYTKQLEKLYVGELSSMGKSRMINTIYFVGELYKKHVIHANIIHRFIQETLESKHYNEKIEALCKMLSVSGKKLDSAHYSKYVNQYFDKFIEIKNNIGDFRMQALMLDVIDLRAANWE